jgi:hypothetical protein
MVVFTDKILKDAENLHYKFQMGCYFSGSKKISGATLLWNDRIKDFFWSYATNVNLNEKTLQKSIEKIVSFFKEKGRRPTVYFTPSTRPRNLPQILERSGFKPKYNDAWMFYERNEPKIAMPQGFVIKEVKTKAEIKIFVNTLNKSYSGATPEEPYGAIPPEYGKCLYDSFKGSARGIRTIHYLGILSKKPVALSTLIYSGRFGCIYNIGTIPSFRGKGIGTAITMHTVADAMKNKVRIIFLQTEQGSFNEKYFASLGFSTKFIGKGLVLED